MTEPHTVIITVAPGGAVTSKIEGISGPKCEGIARILSGLGQIVHTEDTHEMYLHETTEVSNDETVETGNGW